MKLGFKKLTRLVASGMIALALFTGVAVSVELPQAHAATFTAEKAASFFKGKVGSAGTGSNTCLMFVRLTWEQLGAQRNTACCAYRYACTFCSHDDWNIPIGADVFFKGSNVWCSDCGHYAGHVGVYVGNGYMVHNYGGGVRMDKVSTIDATASLDYMGWGYHGGVSIVGGRWEWQNDGVDAPAYGIVGEELEFGADLKICDGAELSYNYAWMLGDDWEVWSSTRKESGSMTEEESWSFVPQEPGIYTLWVDVKDETGKTVTSESVKVPVSKNWGISSIDADSSIDLGQSASYSVNLYDTENLEISYNYAWAYGDDWDEWGSTVRSTGRGSSSKSGSFTPQHAGSYRLWVDAVDQYGRVVTSDCTTLTVRPAVYSFTGLSVNGGAANVGATVYAGEAVTLKAIVGGNDFGMKYNFAWRYGTGWDEWGSTVKSSAAMSSKSSGSFVPKHAGTYYVWADIKDTDGVSQTCDFVMINVLPSRSWELAGVNVASSAKVGDTVTYSAKLSAETSAQLSYNYAWSYEGQWGDNWSSTVLRTGKMSSESSGSFVPTKAGTYYVWIDVQDATGKKLTSDWIAVKVSAPDPWVLTGVNAPDYAYVGDTIDFSAAIKGSKSGLKYNYAWSYEGLWGDNWSSTRLRTGQMTSDTSGSFKPTKAGTYYVWLDVKDSAGTQVTSQRAAITVMDKWQLTGVNAPSSVNVGDTVEFSAAISGGASGLTYNYAWSYEGQWGDNWSSTKLRTGQMTSDTSGSFVPTKAGSYYVWIDVRDASGKQVTSEQAAISVSFNWELTGVSVPSSASKGSIVSFAAKINGSRVGLTYNYAWSYEGQWGDNWSSTVLRTGKMSTESSSSFIPTKSGTYYVWVDVQDGDGKKVTSSFVPVTVQ